MTRRSVGEKVVLPDFRNLGVILRIAVLAEALRFLVAYAHTRHPVSAFQSAMDRSSFFEPALLTLLLLLFFSAFRLAARPYGQGVATVLGLACASALAWQWIFARAFPEAAAPDYPFTVVITLLLATAILGYFNWRHRVLSPALPEARAMALQARIRPHFLFNSLNTVLGLMREDPERAEQVLENLADLYRSLMSESGTLVPMAREIELARSYAEIERVRLGPRLAVDWQCQNAPLDALVPPLILQPLVENGVYHGIEPSEEGGAVTVAIFRRGGQVHIVVRNPLGPARDGRAGNRMALDNIRERLALHFDAEAEMSAYEAGGEYVVQIHLPYKHG